MTGLLDMLQQASNDPATSQGILRFGLSLLQSRGNLSNAFGQAGLQGLQGAQDYRNQQFQNQLRQSQLGQMKRTEQLQNLPSQFVTGGVKPPTMDNRDVGQPGEQAIPDKGFDFSGYTNALMGLDPMQGLQMQALTRKDTAPVKLGAGEKLLNPTTFATLASNPKEGDQPKLTQLIAQRAALPVGDPNRAAYDDAIARETRSSSPGPIQEYEYAKGQGYAGSFDQWSKDQKRAGASNTSVKVENQMGTGLAKEVGPMVKESYDSAKGAQQSITNADSLIKAVDSDKLYAGPGATLKLKGAQLAQVLGIGGKDAAEKIANTRSVIQGLAQATVAARGQLKGQGQVSDYEGKLLQRAASGDVEDLTKQEIRQIATVNKRLSQQVVSNHGQFIQKLRGDQTTAPIANMFDLPAQNVAAPSNVIRYDAQGNRVP